MKLIISSLADAPTVVRVAKPSHLITLLGHDSIDDAPKFADAQRHLKVLVHDINEPGEGLIHPTEAMIEDILAFGRTWNGEAPMLVHCWAGVSRSSAAAFMLACARCPETDEQAIAQRLRKVSRAATPNALMVALADDLLCRGGRMVDAVRAIGVGDYMHPNPPYELPARF